MSRRAVVATVLVATAVVVGVVRSLAHDEPSSAPAPPPVVVTAAPSVLPASPRSESSAVSTPAEPVDEGAGEAAPTSGAGRDTGPAEDSGAGADRRRWEPVAVGFARSFTAVEDGETTDTWRNRLRPYVTKAVTEQLAGVDVSNVPEGRFDGLDLLESSDEQVSVQATYSPGWALVLYLISDGNDHWKVYRYDRLEQ